MTLETKKKIEEKKTINIENYINRNLSTISNKRNTDTIKLLEEFFSNMKSEEKVTNSMLVEYLKDRGVKFSEKEIKTDLPLFNSTKTSSLQSKLVVREKIGKLWIYRKV